MGISAITPSDRKKIGIENFLVFLLFDSHLRYLGKGKLVRAGEVEVVEREVPQRGTKAEA